MMFRLLMVHDYRELAFGNERRVASHMLAAQLIEEVRSRLQPGQQIIIRSSMHNTYYRGGDFYSELTALEEKIRNSYSRIYDRDDGRFADIMVK